MTDLNEEQEQHVKMVEAILFASHDPVSPQALLERLPEGADLNVLLPALEAQYEGRGITLAQVDGYYAFRTVSEVQDALTVEKEVNKKLSKAAMETLAIVAYHQPITRAEIENIRGVATHKGTLDTLMELGWVKPGRRRETPGRPLTWVTTHGFLDHFQLSALTDLPGVEELKASGLLDKRAAIDTLPDTGDLFDNPDEDAAELLGDESAEAEQDAQDIAAIEQADQDAYDEATYKELQKEKSA